MRSTEQYSITLPRAMARIVEEKVASGAYASVSEVVREGVRSLVEREAALDHWLRTEVLASVAEAQAHPDRLIAAPKAFAKVRAAIRARATTRKNKK